MPKQTRRVDPNLEAQLFEQALKEPTEASRKAFLDRVCQGNPALRASLDELLAVHFGHEGFLPRPKSPPPESG